MGVRRHKFFQVLTNVVVFRAFFLWWASSPRTCCPRAIRLVLQYSESCPLTLSLPPHWNNATQRCRYNTQALAYLPVGCLELWNKPSITLLLVHPSGEDGVLLSRTLRALSETHFVGDRVELRLVLGAGDASDPTVRLWRCVYARGASSSCWFRGCVEVRVYRGVYSPFSWAANQDAVQRYRGRRLDVDTPFLCPSAATALMQFSAQTSRLHRNLARVLGLPPHPDGRNPPQPPASESRPLSSSPQGRQISTPLFVK